MELEGKWNGKGTGTERERKGRDKARQGNFKG